ncbi:hypothetical protein [Mycoplasma zalophidermidis]|uniref:hypothetical protein n=1 Tax=Mycoplasma zalophidermidis TaxID=398174 RepID=UPI00215C1D1C|nr:hypothetical protein [Mycoplasma zalophidermidis]MCR8966448.1 hypothetical protein [Mycoplasma zalophidermidis]
MSKNVGRVYIFSVDGIIKKIGGSENVKGMKGTLEIYKNGGLNGQPSSRSIGIWWHLFHELVNNRKIEVHMIYQDNFPGKVKGLFGLSEQNVSISYKHIENACLADYYSVEKRYPDWNYQENNIPWESEIDAILTITKENKGKKGKEKNLDFAKTLKEKGFDTRITRSSEDYDKSENI